MQEDPFLPKTGVQNDSSVTGITRYNCRMKNEPAVIRPYTVI